MDDERRIRAERGRDQGLPPRTDRGKHRNRKCCKKQHETDGPDLAERLEVEAVRVSEFVCRWPELVPGLLVRTRSGPQDGLALDRHATPPATARTLPLPEKLKSRSLTRS